MYPSAPVWKFAVGLGLLGALFAVIDLNGLARALSEVAWTVILLALLAHGTLLMADAWRFSAAFDHYRVTFRDAVRIVLVGLAAGNLLPGMLGAEGYKVYRVYGRSGTVVEPLALVTWLRLNGLTMMAVLSGVYLLVAWDDVVAGLTRSGLTFTGHHLGVIAGAVALLMGSILAMTFGLIPTPARFHTRLGSSLGRAGQALLSLRRESHIRITLGTFVVVSARAVSFSLILASLGTSIPLGHVLLITSAVTVVSMLPLSVGALGVREGGFAVLLIAVGVPEGSAVAAALINRGFLWLSSLVGLAIWALSLDQPAEEEDV